MSLSALGLGALSGYGTYFQVDYHRAATNRIPSQRFPYLASIFLYAQQNAFSQLLNSSPFLSSYSLIGRFYAHLSLATIAARYGISSSENPLSLLKAFDKAFFYLVKGLDTVVLVHSVALVVFKGSLGAAGFLLARLERAFPLLPEGMAYHLRSISLLWSIYPPLIFLHGLALVAPFIDKLLSSVDEQSETAWKDSHKILLTNNYLAGLKRGEEILKELKNTHSDLVNNVTEGINDLFDFFTPAKFAVLQELKCFERSLPFQDKIPEKIVELAELKERIEKLTPFQYQQLEYAIFLGRDFLPEEERETFSLLHHAASYYSNTYLDENDSKSYRPTFLLHLTETLSVFGHLRIRHSPAS